MTTFLLDLWHDLREKRLWPVAAALLGVTLLIPLVLLKGSSHPGATGSTATPSSSSKSLPVVSLADNKSQISNLDAFAKKNPFKSLADPTKNASGNPGSASTGGSTTTTSGGSSTGSGGGAGGGSSTGGGAPTGGGTVTTHGEQLFALSVDVKFGQRGHVKTYKDLKPVSMLPDVKNPVVIFMGMRDFKTAVFVIDSSKYKADGEGTCKPSSSKCDVVTLKLNESSDEETLAADDGTEYTLKLTGVRKTPLSDSQKSTANNLPTSDATPTKTTPKNKAVGKDLPATGGRANDAPKSDLAPLFDLPLFAAHG
jgi:hypothetical protein